MNSRWKKQLLPMSVISIMAFLMFSISSSGCEKEVETIVHDTLLVHDTVEVAVSIISVDSVYADPDSISVGGNISLTTDVTTDLDLGSLTYHWFADYGTFDSATGDTVTWKAPDDEGAYEVSVHVTYGTDIAKGVRVIGVGMYAPTAETYFVGATTCANCHGGADGTHTEWEETGHAEAWAGLMSSSYHPPSCFKCHSVGYFGTSLGADSLGGDAGYDEAPIALYENVQCENCHGPGSAHAASLSAADITVTYEADNCGACHTGPHHPTYDDEWAVSPHSFDPETAFYGGPFYSSCYGCHEGVAAGYRLSADTLGTSFYGGGSIEARPSTDEVPRAAITCAACHDPHNAGNDHQVRTVADVMLVEANEEQPVIDVGGTGKLCMQCHHARRAAEGQIEEGYAHFGPHANPQADMMAGKSAYLAVADAGFTWAQPSHLYVENSCRTCHVHMIPYGVLEEGAVTGHKFEPTVEACERCHGTITDFDEIMALDDFDGDGAIEGVQSEVQGLLDVLEAALYADGLATVDTAGNELDVADALGDTLYSTFTQREAGYNWVFVVDDKSSGVHNPDYAVQLLQQSYKHLTGSLPLNVVPHYGDRKVTAIW